MRIIGIKLNDGEKPVIKNLKPGGWYPFGNYQEPSEENGWHWNKKKESGGQELSYTHYTPINTIYSLRNRYLSVA